MDYEKIQRHMRYDAAHARRMFLHYRELGIIEVAQAYARVVETLEEQEWVYRGAPSKEKEDGD